MSDTYHNANYEPYHVGYNFVIESGNRKIVRTRRIGEETAAAFGYNNGYIHVCVTGNYDSDLWDTRVSPLVYQVWQEIKVNHPYLTIDDNLNHRDVASKTCPGRNLPDNHFRQIIARYEMQHQKPIDAVEEELKRTALKKTILKLKKLIGLLTELTLRRRMK